MRAEPGIGSGEDELAIDSRRWLAIGAMQAVSLPALVLMAANLGFGGLARAAGFSLPQSVVTTGAVWALPSQVVLVGAIGAGAGLFTAALAVTLSAVRLMPMTVALMPILRGRRTPGLVLGLLSHFIAVTPWVEGMRRLPALPREARVSYFAGFVLVLTALNMTATAGGYLLAGILPPLLSAGLLMLTPAYFVIALTNAATTLAERLAMVLGLVAGPLAFMTLPGADLLWSGAVAGTLAYVVDRRVRSRKRA